MTGVGRTCAGWWVVRRSEAKNVATGPEASLGDDFDSCIGGEAGLLAGDAGVGATCVDALGGDDRTTAE